jgi:hypothetical protein
MIEIIRNIWVNPDRIESIEIFESGPESKHKYEVFFEMATGKRHRTHKMDTIYKAREYIKPFLIEIECQKKKSL